MMFLVGLMGMMAVGATAVYGLGLSESDEDADAAAPGKVSHGETDLEATGSGSESVPDLLYAAEPDVFSDENQIEQPGVVSGGGEDSETIEGTTGNDQLNGYAGNDEVLGFEGDDQLYGDWGDDNLQGDLGDDTLHGEQGNDVLNGGDGADELYGHTGADTLEGGMGDDTLHGGSGDDAITDTQGNDALHGGLGNDTLTDGEGADTLFGGWGNDVINAAPDGISSEETDYLNGGGGDDLIIAGQNDIVTAGEGADSIALGDWLSEEHQAEILDFTSGEDSLMVVYDDANGQEPQVSLEQDEDDQDRQHVLINGERVAVVNNAAELSLSDIVLLGQSTLQGLASS